jgi:two-component system cell cycle response regulator DivK
MSHVLVVEDDPHNALVFRKVLERRGGFTVTVTESAPEVLSLVRSGEVDLVIMDVSLADTHLEGKPVSGVDLCRLLKADPRTAGVPVVLATAHAMRGDAEAFIRESQAEGYVSKPILDHDAFVAHIVSLLRKAA